jgi:hypothetical protein
MSRAPGPDIQVGICLGFQNPLQWRIPWPRLYQECLELVDAAEALGFDEVWLSEHHFVDDGYCPSLLPVAAAIAARTKRVRIGTKVMLLPFHDPVRLAEDAAVVDVLSNGRLDLGLAAGYRPAEFAGFCIHPSERGKRMDESLQCVPPGAVYPLCVLGAPTRNAPGSRAEVSRAHCTASVTRITTSCRRSDHVQGADPCR